MYSYNLQKRDIEPLNMLRNCDNSFFASAINYSELLQSQKHNRITPLKVDGIPISAAGRNTNLA